VVPGDHHLEELDQSARPTQAGLHPGPVGPAFNGGLTAIGTWVAQNAILGGFVYGTLNRLLIPLGLHHILNNPPWFILGEFTKADGTVVHGDILRFLAGDPTAGTFMTGFFPIMMFALPAAALAIWQEAKPENRKAVGGIMISVALTSFLTGVTEPLEFAFMFVAWPLYVIHAVFTGLSLAITNALGIKGNADQCSSCCARVVALLTVLVG